MAPKHQIALHCYICPKKPDFSDLSHLLTHVASKGHLLHLHNANLLAQTDLEAKTRLDQYDEWATKNNIAGLVSQRLRMKKNKKSQSAAQHNEPQDHPKPPNPAASQRGSLDENYRPVPHSTPIQSTSTPLSDLTSSGLFVTQNYPVPQLFVWPTSRPAAFEVRPVLYCSPLKRHHKDKSPSQTFPSPQPRDELFYVSSNGFENEDDSVSEAAKLKGVCWPGMDIFDAATPEMKRKRNQKKALSVVEYLEHQSQEVEPIENVFTSSLDAFKRQQPITGQPEVETSPECSPKPPPQKMVSKSRASRRSALPLENKDVNNARRKSPSSGRIRQFQNRKKKENVNSSNARATKVKNSAFTVYDERILPYSPQLSLQEATVNEQYAQNACDKEIRGIPSVYRSAHDGNLLTFPPSFFSDTYHALQGSLAPRSVPYYHRCGPQLEHSFTDSAGFAIIQQPNFSSPHAAAYAHQLLSDDNTITYDSE